MKTAPSSTNVEMRIFRSRSSPEGYKKIGGDLSITANRFRLKAEATRLR
jgi:hypothetical protein